MNETLEKLKEAARRARWQKGALRWAGLLAVCGLLLVFASGWLGEEEPEAAAPLQAEVTGTALETALEQRLQPVISAITGGTDDCIFVTLSGEAQAVYATEGTAGERDSETSYVIIKNADGSQSALKLTEICPEVRGVVVATPRAEDALIRERIVAAVMTAFGIPSSRVCVVLSN